MTDNTATTVINTDAMFYPGYFTAQQKAALKKSSLWNIFLAIHFNSSGRVLLCNYEENIAPAGSGNVSQEFGMFVTTSGVPVIGVIHRYSSNGHIYRIYRAQDFHIPPNKTEHNTILLMESVNPRYIVTKLREGMNRVIRTILAIHRDVERSYQSNTVASLVTWYVKAIAPTNGSAPKIDGSDIQKWAALVATGKKTLIEMPQNYRMVMEQIAEFYDKEAARDTKLNSEINEMFDRDKWVVTYTSSVGYLVAKYNCASLIEPAKKYAASGYTGITATHLAKCIVPPTLYRNIEDMPEPNRTELLSALTHVKIHRSGLGGVNTHVDEKGYLPIENKAYTGAFAAAAVSSSQSVSIMVDA